MAMKPIYRHLLFSVVGFFLFFLALYFLGDFSFGSSLFISFFTNSITFWNNRKNPNLY